MADDGPLAESRPGPRDTDHRLGSRTERQREAQVELPAADDEKRRDVDELSRLSRDLQSLLVATDIATLHLDRRLRIVRFTPGVADLFSLRSTDQGRPLSDVAHRLEYDQLQQDAQQVLDQPGPVEREVRDREGRWYLTRLRPYRSEDRIDGVVLTFVDITRRRLAEERYRTLFESIDAGFSVVEVLFEDGPIDFRIVEVNPAFESQAGLVAAVGRRWRELVPDHEQHWFERYARIARTGEPERFTEHAEGMDDRWFDCYAFPIGARDEHQVATLFRDVTEQRRTQRSLRALTEDLEVRVDQRTREVRELSETLAMAEQQERERLSRVLHDDLQQLLYGIQMQVAMARDGAVDAGLDQVADTTQRALDHIDGAITRTRQLTVDLSPPILEGEGLADAIEWLRSHMRDLHGLEVEIRREHDVDLASPALRVLTFQVVRELLFNIAKHAGVDRAVVTIDQDDDEARVAVVDHGTGFDATAATSDVEHRSGLGLVSARERLRLAGARLEIESTPGHGTRAVIHLPTTKTLHVE